jgi:predicted transcriptional regulator
VYDAVAADPGIALRDLIGSTGYSGGTVVYHIRRLEKARLVTSQRAGRNRRLYVTGASMESRAAIPILRNATARRIAAYLLKHPGAVQRDVCEGVGISPPVAHKYLARLLDAGLVTATRDWKFVHYRPEERLHSLVATVGYDGLEQRAAPMAPIPAISQRAQPVSA